MMRIIRTKSGNTFDLFVSGHAMYADKGKDIVCSAASALIYTLAINMDDLASYYDIDTNEDEYVHHIGAAGKDSMMLCDAIMKTLKSMQEEYPDYLEIEDQEDEYMA